MSVPYEHHQGADQQALAGERQRRVSSARQAADPTGRLGLIIFLVVVSVLFFLSVHRIHHAHGVRGLGPAGPSRRSCGLNTLAWC